MGLIALISYADESGVDLGTYFHPGVRKQLGKTFDDTAITQIVGYMTAFKMFFKESFKSSVMRSELDNGLVLYYSYFSLDEIHSYKLKPEEVDPSWHNHKFVLKINPAEKDDAVKKGTAYVFDSLPPNLQKRSKKKVLTLNELMNMSTTDKIDIECCSFQQEPFLEIEYSSKFVLVDEFNEEFTANMILFVEKEDELIESVYGIELVNWAFKEFKSIMTSEVETDNGVEDALQALGNLLDNGENLKYLRLTFDRIKEMFDKVVFEPEQIDPSWRQEKYILKVNSSKMNNAVALSTAYTFDSLSVDEQRRLTLTPEQFVSLNEDEQERLKLTLEEFNSLSFYEQRRLREKAMTLEEFNLLEDEEKEKLGKMALIHDDLVLTLAPLVLAFEDLIDESFHQKISVNCCVYGKPPFLKMHYIKGRYEESRDQMLNERSRDTGESPVKLKDPKLPLQKKEQELYNWLAEKVSKLRKAYLPGIDRVKIFEGISKFFAENKLSDKFEHIITQQKPKTKKDYKINMISKDTERQLFDILNRTRGK